jgi:hypothetical protein
VEIFEGYDYQMFEGLDVGQVYFGRVYFGRAYFGRACFYQEYLNQNGPACVAGTGLVILCEEMHSV